MYRFILIAALAVSACKPDFEERLEVADGNSRAALQKANELEARIDELESKAQMERAAPAVVLSTASDIPARFMLTGPASMSGTGTKFPSQERCEAARAAIISQAEERAARLKERGIITVGEPQVSCMPL